jgi:hypothetical protein
VTDWFGRNEDGLEVGQSSLDDHFLDVSVLPPDRGRNLWQTYFLFVHKYYITPYKVLIKEVLAQVVI